MSIKSVLHVVACVANPMRWKSRTRLARMAVAGWVAAGASVTLVECAYGDQDHEMSDTPGLTHYVPVRASAENLAWNKENLWNLGRQHLPRNARYVCFWDADILCRNDDWADRTLHALQHHPVVQPWSDALDLGPDGEMMETHRSLFFLHHRRQPIQQGPNSNATGYRFGHPGFGLAFRLDVLDRLGGLVETAALGAGDHHMTMALLGRVEDSIPGDLTWHYKAPLIAWQQRAAHLGRNVAHVRNVIEHHWHGNKNGAAGRKYVERWHILRRHHFDPVMDLIRNGDGVVELAGNKPELRRDMLAYFAQRSEDANIIF